MTRRPVQPVQPRKPGRPGQVGAGGQSAVLDHPRIGTKPRTRGSSSGIGSGLFNACRQVGTATGLAILGSIGVSVTLADWQRQAASFPSAEQQRATQVAAHVAGGQVHAAAAYVNGRTLDPAVNSFLRGFEFALLLAAVILVIGGIVGFRGLRHLRITVPSERQLTDSGTSD